MAIINEKCLCALLLLFILTGILDCRYVSFSRHLLGIIPRKDQYIKTDLGKLPLDFQGDTVPLSTEQDVNAESNVVPNVNSYPGLVISDYYKLVVTINVAKTNLDENVVNNLREAFAKQLKLSVRNVRVSQTDPYLGTIEMYFIYPMVDGFRGSESKENLFILSPASEVLESISINKLKAYMNPNEIVSVYPKAHQKENFSVHTSKEEIKVWSVVKDDIWSSWHLPVIISSSLFIVFLFILLIWYLCSRHENKKKLLSLDEPQQVVFQPVHKPVVTDANTIQPENKDNYLSETGSENTSSPSKSPLRIKAKGLLERRGSNASLTLDLNRSQENLQCGTPPKECSTEEFLLSAGNRMTRKQLHHCLKDVKALHSEFWEIPMNHPEKVEIPGSGTKNRYKTIMPNEQSRVQLSQNGDPLANYINANYIRGYDGEPKTYIATQGPMAHTVSDFWLMVWKEKAPIIVMITKLKEKNKVKCEPYVPEYTGCYGDIEITVMKVTPRDGYTIRELFLKHDEEIHQVYHFWYTAWPDHKTPSTAKQLLSMALEVEALRHDENGIIRGPTVVHCSAGIGRTGCFIATSIGIQQLLEENMVDVLGIVCALRLDRGGMVQTAEQYEFVHQALYLFEHSMPEQMGE